MIRPQSALQGLCHRVFVALTAELTAYSGVFTGGQGHPLLRGGSGTLSWALQKIQEEFDGTDSSAFASGASRARQLCSTKAH